MLKPDGTPMTPEEEQEYLAQQQGTFKARNLPSRNIPSSEATPIDQLGPVKQEETESPSTTPTQAELAKGQGQDYDTPPTPQVGMVETERQTSEIFKATPEQMRQMRQASIAEKEAEHLKIKAEGEVKTSVAEAKATLNRWRDKPEAAQLFAQIEGMDKAEADRIGEFGKQIKTERERLDNLDPAQRKAFWDVSSNGQKFGTIMQIVAGALKGMATSRTGNGDTSAITRALTQANKIVDDDYQNQINRIDAAEKKFDRLIKSGELDRKVFDQMRATAIARTTYLQDQAQAQFNTAVSEAEVRGLPAQNAAALKLAAAQNDSKLIKDLINVSGQRTVTSGSKLMGGEAKLSDQALKIFNDFSDSLNNKNNFLGAYVSAASAYKQLTKPDLPRETRSALVGKFIAGADGMEQGSFGESLKKMTIPENVKTYLQKLYLNQMTAGDIPPDEWNQVVKTMGVITASKQGAAKTALNTKKPVFQAAGIPWKMATSGLPMELLEDEEK
jgi:hypothetical protein